MFVKIWCNRSFLLPLNHGGYGVCVLDHILSSSGDGNVQLSSFIPVLLFCNTKNTMLMADKDEIYGCLFDSCAPVRIYVCLIDAPKLIIALSIPCFNKKEI
jgi:hypothetical protein